MTGPEIKRPKCKHTLDITEGSAFSGAIDPAALWTALTTCPSCEIERLEARVRELEGAITCAAQVYLAQRELLRKVAEAALVVADNIEDAGDEGDAVSILKSAIDEAMLTGGRDG